MPDQFLEVIPAEEAHRRFRAAVRPGPLGSEMVSLGAALGRVLAEDVASPIDVPGFDRSHVDGFAVRAEDTFGAEESAPVSLRLNDEVLATGVQPRIEVRPGTATRIATGGIMPRGADAVAMVEHCRVDSARGVVALEKALVPAANVGFAGGDVARGEVVVRAGARLSARETGTIAALGLDRVAVHRRPRVALYSTGDEIVAPGAPLPPGAIFDSNQRILADSLREIGCEPIELGIVPDDRERLVAALRAGLDHDAVILSGGTSKGEGDHGVAAVREVATVLCHGVALKPGKPLCLAAAGRKPVVVLPGFPTSAVFTFHEFVAPVLAELAGAPSAVARVVRATSPLRLNTERGRAEFVLVSLLEGPAGPVAYPMGKGSGSVTAFARADGFITLGRQQEFVEAGETVEVRLIGRAIEPADLVAIGSHCVGLDWLLSRLARDGFAAKAMIVGSQGGFLAAQRGECDLGGVHLCDASGTYNTPFVPAGCDLLRGYGRMQGVVFREREPELATSMMVNRNRGSGTRVVIDELLGAARPPGYHAEARSHNAVAAAVAQGRADWGVAIAPVAAQYGLGFRPLREERYDFVVPASRRERPAVRAFERLLASDEARAALRGLGFSA